MSSTQPVAGHAAPGGAVSGPVQRHLGLALLVIATAQLPRGTITWVRCRLDRTFSLEEAVAMGPVYQPVIAKYMFTDGDGRVVLCWDHGRYMNHSCEPSCVSPGFECDIAVRDILPGEELTCDYAMLNLDEALDCACGSGRCRRRILPGEGVALADRLDDAVALAFAEGQRVPQPLLPLMVERGDVLRAFRGEGPETTTRRHLRWGKVRPKGVRVEVQGGYYRLVVTEPVAAGDVIVRLEGPAVDDLAIAALDESERALAVRVRGRMVVPRNEVRFVTGAAPEAGPATPNARLDDDGDVRALFPLAPGAVVRAELTTTA